MLRTPIVALGLALGACAGHSPSTSPAPERSAVATTRWFAFHSSEWVNLHHFLYVLSRARSGLDSTRASVTASLADTVGYAQLPEDQKAAWRAALDYYARFVAK